MMKTLFPGEILMRLEASDHLRIVQTDMFRNLYTGAEMNAAVMMHCLGAKNLYLVTAFPENALGDAAMNAAEHWGVRTDYSIRKPGRLGLFFLEQGFGVRPSAVIYDRADSVFARSKFEDYDFGKIFTAGDWVYVSGTMPALTPEMPEFVEKMLSCASQKGCTVCFDLNYRATLWPWERAAAVFRNLMRHVDVLLGNESLAQAIFQIPAAELCRTFSLRYAALTRREENDAQENRCSAVIYADDGSAAVSRTLQAKMLDRIGGGDAFSGAVLYALQQGMPLQECADFAVAAQVLKQTVRGDFGLVTKEEIEQFLTQGTVSVRR